MERNEAGMAEAVAEERAGEDAATQDKISWGDHVASAVKAFLKTAVVIDNEPAVRGRAETPVVDTAISQDFGLGDDDFNLVPPQLVEGIEHELDLRVVSNKFASLGIGCAFVLPDDQDNNDEEKVRMAVSAAKVSDLVVVDWYLRKQDSTLTRQILKRIAESDLMENGRLRLICIYTGEPLVEAIFRDAKDALASGGLPVEDAEVNGLRARGPNTILLVRNKSETPAAELPRELIAQFSQFADGVIPSFALAAVGAIRKNAHHMLTRFGAWLDTAYISNYIITDPRSDVPELMREMFVAECDSALGVESIADRYLHVGALAAWLDENREKIAPQQLGVHRFDTGTLVAIMNGRSNGKTFMKPDGTAVKVLDKNRHLISTSLAGSVEKSKQSEHEFSRLVTMKREAFGRTKLLGDADWRPSLTTGTLLRTVVAAVNEDQDDKRSPVEAESEYLICLTPACDTLRLASGTPFVFLKAHLDLHEYGIVLRDKGDVDVMLKLDAGMPIIRTYTFEPDEALQRVMPVHSNATEFRFESSERVRFDWLGEVRYTQAVSEMAKLVGNWMRIGVGGSEFLRLTSRGEMPKPV